MYFLRAAVREDARVLSPHSGAGSFAGTPPANLGECEHPADTLSIV